MTDAVLDEVSPIEDVTTPTVLSQIHKAGWGVGSLGATSLIYLQSLFVLYFFTVILGIEPGIAGTAILLSKVSDIVCGLLIGRASDGLRTRWGRRRPFLAAGALVATAGTILVFNPPVVNPIVQCASLMVMGLGYCLFTVPYLALPSEVTSSADERVQMMSWRVIFVSTAELIAKSALPLVVAAYAGKPAGYSVMSLVAAAAIGGSMMVAFFLSPKEPTLPARLPKAERLPPGSWAQVAANRPFVLLMLTKIPQAFGLYVSLATLLFFFTSVLGGTGKLVALWGLCSNLASMAAIPFWFWMSRRVSKRSIFVVGVLGYVTVSFSWLLAHHGDPAWMVALRAVITGPFAAGLLLSSQSMLPEAIAYSTAATGVRQEGTYAAAYSLTEKTCSALAPFAVGWILQFVGLNGKTAIAGHLSHQALSALYITVGVIPGVAYLVGLIPMAFYALKTWGGVGLDMEKPAG
ncbi:MFS transporter [Phenylobacterium aquaticum]|uniref:MFS transporter n=1 Tax=Phenylobacterium aquaticum TaxID=1763816 RepID=UPI0026F1629F|nr:MFS transporter [Phenylobacterium aquaticum]